MRRPSVDELEPVQALYDQGLYLQAYEIASRLAPLSEWSGGIARGLAGRLAYHLGAPRMSQGHQLLAYREQPELPEVKFQYVMTVLGRRGPYAAWLLLKEFGDLPESAQVIRSEWHALHAQVVAAFRDFDAAEAWLARAESLPEATPWVSIVHAGVLQLEDRYEEALEMVSQVLSMWPWYRPAVQLAAHLKILLSRDEEALSLLAEADNHIEVAAIVGQQITILTEQQRYLEAWNRLERMIELMPLMEQDVAKATAGIRSNIAYFLKDIDTAVEFGRKSGSPFLEKVAERLSDPTRKVGQRVTLPLAFVRQHYQTCGPATLTMISRYWSKPAEHLEIADQICYDGTKEYSERRWARENDWLVREFTVTEQSIIDLIDNGVPFTLATYVPGNGHLQAVIGYDSRRGTVLIRDPFIHQIGEAFIEELLQDQAASGPRGMALVPLEMGGTLDSLELPDGELWDQLHRLDGALERYHWPEAEKIYQEMVLRNPKHRLTLTARLRLAIYDANPVMILSAVESLLEQYPENQNLELTRLSSLSELGRRDELLSSYKEICSRKGIHPIFLKQYAAELFVEAHEQERAIRLLRRAIRIGPLTADNYFAMGNISASQGKFEYALELFRIATCFKDKDERFARSYFQASVLASRAEEALEFIKKRWERYGHQSSLSARTLAWAYGRLDRWQEAVNVLDNALALHPEDGDLMLEAADLLRQASRDHSERADALLAGARNRAPRSHWLRAAAGQALRQGKPALALEYWLEILTIQPLAIDAHNATTHLLATTQGDQAALSHVEAYATQFAHNYPLQKLLVEWRRELGPNHAYLDSARELVELVPQNDVGLGYLGEALLRNDHSQEAYTVFQKAVVLNPANIYAALSLFDLQIQKEDLDAAAETLKQLEPLPIAPHTIAASVELALKQNDVNLVKAGLEKLCVTTGDNGLALSTTTTKMIEAGATTNVFLTLNEAIRRLDAIPEVGFQWMRCCFVLNQGGCVTRLKDLCSVGVAGETATEFYIMQMLNSGQHGALFRFIERNARWLHEKASNWGNVAFALQQIGEVERAMHWIQNWQGQQGLQPRMLVAPAELLWDAGRTDEMVEVIEHALLLPADGGTPVHRMWLGAWMALSGDPSSGLGQLGLVNPRQLNQRRKPTYQLVSATVKISLAAKPDRWQLFRSLRDSTQKAILNAAKLPGFRSSSRGIYRQLIKHIGHEVGDIRSWVWCYWMWFRLR